MEYELYQRMLGEFRANHRLAKNEAINGNLEDLKSYTSTAVGVLNRMYEMGFITVTEYNDFMHELSRDILANLI